MEAKALLATGGMGSLLGASLFIVADQTRLCDPAYQTSWRADRARAGGGILMGLGVHLRLEPVITHRFAANRMREAYELARPTLEKLDRRNI